MKKIQLYKHTGYIYTLCLFCGGDIPLDMSIDHHNDTICIAGACKRCNTYINIDSAHRNFKLWNQTGNDE